MITNLGRVGIDILAILYNKLCGEDTMPKDREI